MASLVHLTLLALLPWQLGSASSPFKGTYPATASAADIQRQATRTNVWPSDRQCSTNQGSAPGVGAGSYPGLCKDDWVGYQVPDTIPSGFVSSGVSSTATSPVTSYFAGDLDGLLWMFTDLGNSTIDTIALVPQILAGVSSLTGIDGFWSSAATTPDTVDPTAGGQDLVIAPSLDGHVYALSQSKCNMDTSTVRVSGLGICLVWAFASPNNNSFAGPPRVAAGLGMVFVTETDPLLATAGTLRALNLTTGVEITNPSWPFTATYDGLNYPLIGTLPASSPLTALPDEHLIVAYGPVLVVLDGRAGYMLASIDTITPHGSCPMTSGVFVSSPAVFKTSQITASIFLQSGDGDLYAYTLTDDSNNPGTLALSCNWICRYTRGSTACEALQARTIAGSSGADAWEGSSGAGVGSTAGANGVVVNDSTAAHVGSTVALPAVLLPVLVPGGWYDPSTTRGQREELHAAIRTAHVKLHGPEARHAIAARWGVGTGRFNGQPITDPSLEVAALARQLPDEAMHGLVTPSGYRPLGTDGQPLHAGSRLRDIFGSVYYRSTPAISPDGQFVAYCTFGDGTSDSTNGIIVAKTGDGSLQAPSYMITSAGEDINGKEIPYARSRSNPAWDGESNLYVSADWDFSAAGQGHGGSNDTLPALAVYSLDSGDPRMVWGTELGREQSAAVGTASPVIVDGVNSTVHRVLHAGTDGSYHSITGCPFLCPSSNPVTTCSGHGVCDGQNGGACSCADAYHGDPMCYNFTGCGHGIADIDGNCHCSPCWHQDGNGSCNVPLDCQHGGYCEVGSTGGEICLCPFCWNNTQPDNSGLCTVGPRDCGPNSVGCDIDECLCEHCTQPSEDGASCVPINCGNGACYIGNGTCVCNPCFAADPSTGACTVPFDCGNGVCFGPTGTCECNPCWNPGPGTGVCTVPLDCLHGNCDASGAGTCECDTCWQMDDSGLCSIRMDCGPGGVCDANDGQCVNNGDNCWLYDRATGRYDTYQTCSNRGTCNDATGDCTCNSGWSNVSIPNPCSACDACHSGINTCITVFACSGHGKCTLGDTAADRVCLCDHGWTGPTCDEPAT